MEEGVQIVQRFYDALNRKDIEAVMGCFQVDAALFDPFVGWRKGEEGIRRYFTSMLRNLPNIHFTIQRSVCAGQDVAIVWLGRWTGRGGELREVTGAEIYHMAHGKIQSVEFYYDTAPLRD